MEIYLKNILNLTISEYSKWTICLNNANEEGIYSFDEDSYQGGSGAGCSSLVFCSYIYNLMCQNKIKKVLLVATGALLSSLSCQQGESIPGVSHAVALEM